MNHDYLSTHCLHDSHWTCRLTCKFCKAPCKCWCHQHQEPDPEDG